MVLMNGAGPDTSVYLALVRSRSITAISLSPKGYVGLQEVV
jgi:hypothetical protein